MQRRTNTEIAESFLQYIGTHYEELQKKYREMQRRNGRTFSMDVFDETILRCYDTIEKKGIADDTSKGYENYFFMSFKTNTLADAVSSYNQRGVDLEEEDFNKQLADYLIANEDEAKIYSQLLNDYLVTEILKAVEDNFSQQDYFLFRVKYLCKKMTYKKLREITGITNCKKRVLEVKKWCRENIDKNKLEKTFRDDYETD